MFVDIVVAAVHTLCRDSSVAWNDATCSCSRSDVVVASAIPRHGVSSVHLVGGCYFLVDDLASSWYLLVDLVFADDGC